MNATRLKTDPLAQDLGTSRPVLSAAAGKGGLLSGLLQAIMPSKSKAQRAEPRLVAENGGTEERREPYLFGQRPTAGAAD
jgi:hypothetical protein